MLAKLGHDLRDPVGTMMFLTQVLMDQMGERATPQDRKLFEAIVRLGQKALQLTDDVVSLSASKRGELDLLLQDVSLNEIASESISANCAKAESKRVRLVLDAPTEIPAVRLDRSKILRAVNELVCHAIDASEPETTVEVRARSFGRRLAGIVVRDEGPEISPDEAKQLFAPFSRNRTGRKQPARQADGLGLAVARAIIRAHGGRIRVRSEAEEGNRFIISFPLRTSST